MQFDLPTPSRAPIRVSLLNVAMLSANAACRQHVVASGRYLLATSASVATTSTHQLGGVVVTRQLCRSAHTSNFRPQKFSASFLASADHHRTAATPARRFTTSTSRAAPPFASAPPEPAISRPLDTPPGPIAAPGRIKGKDEGLLATPLWPEDASSSSFTKARGTEHEEACNTLSPSSPAAPRSQPTRHEKNAASTTVSSTTPPPEVVSQPAPARKGGAKFRPQKAALSLTPTALERVRSLLDASGGPKLLRIGVRNKGCAGMSYHLEYVTPEQAGKFDERVKQDGVEVLIDSKALFSIIGSEMDWQEDRLSAKFVFNNPNVVEACGCGESVRFA